MKSELNTIDKIFLLKDEYYKLRPIIDEGANPMLYPELLRIRKELSCLSLDYAREIGVFTKDYIRLEAQCDVQRYLKQEELILNGQKIGAAETSARASIADLREQEATASGMHKTGQMILSQVNEILFSMRQEISILKKEYENISMNS